MSLVEKYFTVASYQVEELSEPSVLLAFQLQGLFFVSRNFEKFGTVNSRTEILVNFKLRWATAMSDKKGVFVSDSKGGLSELSLCKTIT